MNSAAIAVSTYTDKLDNQPKPHTVAWPALADRLMRHDRRASKDGALMSPTIYREGATRSNTGVEALTAAVMDLDHLTPGQIDEILSRRPLSGCQWVAHTTYRHTPDAPRWRLVIPFVAPVPAMDWPDIWKRLAALIPEADPARKDLAGIYYLPSCPPDAIPEARKSDGGELLDPYRLPPVERPAPPPPAPTARRETGDGALALFTGWADRLDTAAGSGNGRGGRNRTLYSLMAEGLGRGLAVSDVEAVARDYSRRAGLLDGAEEERAAERTIRSAIDRHQREPFAGNEPERQETKHMEADDKGATLSGQATDAPYSADSLRDMEFPELRWAIPSLIVEGCTILASRPKIGKSWMTLDLALSVAVGGEALGAIKGVESGAVLLAALEDSPRRLKARIKKLGGLWPKSLHIVHVLPRMGEGCIEYLDAWLKEHPGARLIVIDTLTRIRPPRAKGADVYLEDSVLVAHLQALAQRRNVAILLVYHTRKAPTLDDPFDAVTGSLGLTGSADAAMVLIRQRNQADATLHMTGRDVEEKALALKFDAETCRWTLLGDADTVKTSEERQKILDLLAEADGPMSPKEIAEALDRKPGAIRNLLAKMAKAGEIAKPERGMYESCGDKVTMAADKAPTESGDVTGGSGSGDNRATGDNLDSEQLSFVTGCHSGLVTADSGTGTLSEADCHVVTGDSQTEEWGEV